MMVLSAMIAHVKYALKQQEADSFEQLCSVTLDEIRELSDQSAGSDFEISNP